MGKQSIKRNERNKENSELDKLDKEYKEPIFSIEETKITEETKFAEDKAEALSDPVVKEQLNSIVAGASITAAEILASPGIPIKGDIPTQEINVNPENMTDTEHADAEDSGSGLGSGGMVPADAPVEDEAIAQADIEKKITEGNAINESVGEVNEGLLEKLNEAAETILKCLPDEMAKDFRTACFKDFNMKDMGIYLMGLLNRLYKVGDYYNPDIEPEWDKRVVGYSSELYCNNCNKLIENSTNLNQLFCSNLCSKNYKERYSTGVIRPSEKDRPTEEEQDQEAWDKEL